ncbi:response regulator [Roseococcus sp. SDR]|uniref:ATP-binding response regulator n=1 Tax=Roseococcus sp. SDR TaxID=2835532 RepID=UPI001BCF31E1|nr:response regulator [Roseococcus sp. SDR]MBS7789994.1 response regulator [Roseococcus sp. SDR]MBV1845308.1 response regulator [Roseococcus sp. SDR]
MSHATNPGSVTWADGTAIGVLVVDDEPVVAEQLAQGLAAHGMCTGFVHNATDALARLDADPAIGVVVTDIRMPGGDGLGLAQRILSQRPASAAVEVIIITGHATIEDATAAVRTGVADFLRKPFRLAEAVQAVTKAMGRVVTQRALASERAAVSDRLARMEQERAALQGQMRELGARLAAQSAPAAATAAIERDMAAISHALRTPLIAISGGAELLAHGGLSRGDEAEYHDLLRGGVQRVVQAVELVEELHRIERPASDEEPAAVPLAPALRAAVAAARPLADAKRLRLGATPVLPELAATGTPSRLRRAVEQCVLAAADWCAEGGDVLALLEPHEEAGAGWALVTLLAGPADGLDTPPPGIAFPLAGSAHARTQESLHFAIARRIAEQHGGQVTSWNGGPGRMAIRLALRQ